MYGMRCQENCPRSIIMFSIKIFKTADHVLLAVCDKELLGREFREGEKLLKIGSFYAGENCDEVKLKKIIKEATIINAVGEKAVKVLESMGLIHPEAVIRIKDIPHVQVVKL